MQRKTFISRNNYIDISPPKDGDSFEDLCLDVLPSLLKKHGIQITNKLKNNYTVRHGVSGDKQFGVDLIDYATYATAQCKNTKSLTISEIKKELEDFSGYPNHSSIHFILSSLPGTSTAIQNHINEINSKNEKQLESENKFPTKPSECMPRIVFVNWNEIKNEIYSSLRLSLKWGALPAILNKYPTLIDLDIDLLKKLCLNAKTLKRESKLIERGDSSDSFLAMTKSINIKSLIDFKSSAKIHSSTFYGVMEFLNGFEFAMSKATNLQETERLCSSQDHIEMWSGLEQLNEAAILTNRIRILPFIHELYELLRDFIREYDIQDLYTHPEVELEDNNYGSYCIEDTSIRQYQFAEEDEHAEYYCQQISQEKTIKLIKNIEEEYKKTSKNLLKK